jgi:hypothetical protein
LPQAQHPFLDGIFLELNYQGIVPEGLLGFFRSDPVPRDMLPIVEIPIEFHAYSVHTMYGEVKPGKCGANRRLIYCGRGSIRAWRAAAVRSC